MAPQVMYNVLDFWRRQADSLEPRARSQATLRCGISIAERSHGSFDMTP
jgi:hypothetical protein